MTTIKCLKMGQETNKRCAFKVVIIGDVLSCISNHLL